jgi:hypothetical protein
MPYNKLNPLNKLVTDIIEEESEDGSSSIGNYSYVYEPLSDKTNRVTNRSG